MSSYLEHINENNLSIAWAKAFIATMKHPEVSPLTITVNGLNNTCIHESDDVRIMLDKSLSETGHHSCETVAGTIFPKSLWNSNVDACVLFDRYRKCRTQIRKHRHNRKGVYFDRLIAYGIDYSNEPINQLDYIIETYTEKGNHRRSALYASVFDPRCDATHQKQRGFPCLQQVGFVPMGQKYLNVVGFYPTEYIYSRGYGNYLGLCRLGQFMAQEMGLTLSKMTCFVGVGKYGSTQKLTKSQLRKLQNAVELYIINH